jgi:hypothetical protein
VIEGLNISGNGEFLGHIDPGVGAKVPDTKDFYYEISSAGVKKVHKKCESFHDLEVLSPEVAAELEKRYFAVLKAAKELGAENLGLAQLNKTADGEIVLPAGCAIHQRPLAQKANGEADFEKMFKGIKSTAERGLLAVEWWGLHYGGEARFQVALHGNEKDLPITQKKIPPYSQQNGHACQEWEYISAIEGGVNFIVDYKNPALNELRRLGYSGYVEVMDEEKSECEKRGVKREFDEREYELHSKLLKPSHGSLSRGAKTIPAGIPAEFIIGITLCDELASNTAFVARVKSMFPHAMIINQQGREIAPKQKADLEPEIEK